VKQFAHFIRSRTTTIACTWVLIAGCGGGSAATGTGGTGAATGGTGAATGGTAAVTGGTGAVTGGSSGTGGGAAGVSANTGGARADGGSVGTGEAGRSAGGGSGAASSGGRSGGTGQAGAGGSSGHTGGSTGSAGHVGGTAGAGGGATSSCVGMAWPTADPTTAGPFSVTADKGVGPLAGVVPDPVYGDTQQRFNIYRPTNLAQSGYCHPILVWANGHTDNPEPNPPLCVSSKYCGSYQALVTQLASHGFVVIASLSTITSQGNPLPTIIGLDWLLQQAEDPASPYYHRLDTAHIGALGHSEGGFSTSKASSDPRISAIATVSGSAVNAGIHGPSLWFCGAKDTVVSCDSVMKTYAAITNQPAMLVNNLAADHGGWLYQNGAKGPDIFGLTAWFRVHLMNDTANRKMFYGADCTLCKDSRVQVTQNSLMTQ